MLSLTSRLRPFEHRPVGHHRLDPEAEVAGVAVAQHVDPAGVGAEQAADPRRALGGERQREEPAGLAGRGLDVGEHAAGLGDEDVVDEVEVADAVQPLDREDDRQRPVLEDLPADETGAAGIGDDPDPRLGAERAPPPPPPRCCRDGSTAAARPC